LTQNKCLIDGAPIPDVAAICHACTTDIEKALAYIPELMDDLAVTFTKRAKVVNYGDGTPSPEDGKPMVYSVAASRARENIKGVLTGWVLYVHTERTTALVVPGLGDNPEHTLQVRTPITCQDTATSMAGWLAQFTGWFRFRDYAVDLHQELTDAVRELLSVMDAQPSREYIGRCGFTWQSVVCTGELWATPGDDLVRCRVCHTDWNVDQRREDALAGVMERVESPEVIARALGRHGVNISAERIYNWRKRGKLHPVAHDRLTRRARYRMQDVLDLYEAMQRSPQNTQRPKDT
jgi:hypothetical protein